jgi:hypothetical protein
MAKSLQAFCGVARAPFGTRARAAPRALFASRGHTCAVMKSNRTVRAFGAVVVAAVACAWSPAAALGVVSVAREGSVMVVRADPGVNDTLQVNVGPLTLSGLPQGAITLPAVLTMPDPGVVAGDGCVLLPGPFIPAPGPVRCALDGISQVLVSTADGNDTVFVSHGVGASRRVPFVLDGGAGNDLLGEVEIHGSPSVAPLTLIGGPGNDRLLIGQAPTTADGGEGDDNILGRPSARVGPGPWIATGGPGNDVVDFDVDGGRGSIDAGPGDDTIKSDISLSSDPLGGDAIDCGPGADKQTLEERDAVSPSCAPHLRGLSGKPRLTRSSPSGHVRPALGRMSKAGRVAVVLLIKEHGVVFAIGAGNTRSGPGPVRIDVRLNLKGRHALARASSVLIALARLRASDHDGNVEHAITQVRLGRPRNG